MKRRNQIFFFVHKRKNDLWRKRPINSLFFKVIWKYSSIFLQIDLSDLFFLSIYVEDIFFESFHKKKKKKKTKKQQKNKFENGIKKDGMNWLGFWFYLGKKKNFIFVNENIEIKIG